MPRITPEIPTASGHRKGWVKAVTGINPGLEGGYALEGEFLQGRETDLEAGTLLVRCCPTGSVKNGSKEYDWGRVTEVGIDWDGEDYTHRTWLSFLDALRKQGVPDLPSEPKAETTVGAANSAILSDVQRAMQRLATPGIKMGRLDEVKNYLDEHRTIHRTPDGWQPRAFVDGQALGEPVIDKVAHGGSFVVIPINGWALTSIGEAKLEDTMPNTHEYYLLTKGDKALFIRAEFYENDCTIAFIPSTSVPEYLLASLAK